MRQLYRPTREQKVAIVKCGYNPDDYKVMRNGVKEDRFVIIHKDTHEQIEIYY